MHCVVHHASELLFPSQVHTEENTCFGCSVSQNCIKIQMRVNHVTIQNKMVQLDTERHKQDQQNGDFCQSTHYTK
jgi:hypothetical protein